METCVSPMRVKNELKNTREMRMERKDEVKGKTVEEKLEEENGDLE